MTLVLIGCAAITVVAVWFAVFAARRWYRAMSKLVIWQEQWNLAPEMCAVCGLLRETPVHVPAELESRVLDGHRYLPARLVRQAPGLLLPTRELVR